MVGAKTPDSDVNCRIEGEYEEGQRFAFGFAIKELVVYGVNANWEKCFIDRTEEGPASEPTRKVVNLNAFSLYLLSAPAPLAAPAPAPSPDVPQVNKEHLILKPSIKIRVRLPIVSLTIRITHVPSSAGAKEKQSGTGPSLLVQIDLPRVNLQLSKSQYEICLFVGDRVNHYFNALSDSYPHFRKIHPIL